MAPSQSLYPRNTLKRIVRAHSNRPLSKNADVLIFLDYALFMQALVREAAIQSRQAGERGVSARRVRRATELNLRRFKG